MKKLILIISIICISNCHKKASETDLLNKANPEGKYGTEISIMENEEISTLLNAPNKYLGKDVLVSGKITEVCPMRGCWIDVKDVNTDSHIRIKVTDGQIVFPISAKGKYVDVQGEFTKLNFTEEQAINWKIHLAEEQGVKLNYDDVKITPDDLVEYRINGTGANIYTYGCK